MHNLADEIERLKEENLNLRRKFLSIIPPNNKLSPTFYSDYMTMSSSVRWQNSLMKIAPKAIRCQVLSTKKSFQNDFFRKLIISK